MIGMHMGVEHLYQLEIELIQKLQVTLGPIEDTVDEQRLAAFAAGEKIRVGAGLLVKKLAKYHAAALFAVAP